MPVTIDIANSMTITGIGVREIEALKERFDFQFSKRVWSLGKTQYESARWPVVYESPDHHEAYLPYGTLLDVVTLLRELGHEVSVVRKTAIFPKVGFPGLIQEREDREGQSQVLEDIRAYTERTHHYGYCLTAPCGGGKSWMACRLIDMYRQPTLIVVHTRELLRQWSDVIETAFGITPKIIANGKGTPGPHITIGLVQTLRRMVHGYSDAWGMVIFDECHHVPAETFAQVAGTINATVKVGLTASPKRSDGLHPLITGVIGPIVSSISQDSLYRAGDAMPAKVQVIRTGWNWKNTRDPAKHHTRMVGEMILDRRRNECIVREVVKAARDGRHVLLLSSRLAHLDLLADLLSWEDIPYQLLTGTMRDQERQATMQRMQDGFPITLAIEQLAKEGLDAPILDTLAWGTPCRNETLVQQAVGRIQRTLDGKPTPLVLDFRDDHFTGPGQVKSWPNKDSARLLGWQFYARQRVYRRIGVSISGDC